MNPHEHSIPGKAASLAIALNAQLPVLETPRLRLRAPVLGDFEHWAEATAAARDHAQAQGMPSLVSYVAPANARSARLAKGLGAVLDGTVDGSDVWRHWPKAASAAAKEAS